MRVIIAGGRNFDQYKLLKYKCLEILRNYYAGDITIIQGGAKGADALAAMFAKERGFRMKQVDADWKDVTALGAVVKEGQYGLYNARAGVDRNRAMAEEAEMLIAFWDGKSPGTKNMIDIAKEECLTVHVIKY